MTVQWTLYDENTGRILRSGDAMDETQAGLQATGGGRIVMVNSDPATQIVTNPQSAFPGITTKSAGPMAANKTNIAINGTDTVVISNVPAGALCHVTVPQNVGILDIPDFTISDGVLVLTVTVAGAYTVKISSFPNADFVVTINAA